MHRWRVGEHQPIQAHLRRFAPVIQLFAQALAEFGINVVLLDGVVHPGIERHRHAQLPQIRLHSARHIRVLQLAGDIRAVGQGGAMHLAQARRRHRLLREGGKAAAPVRPELRGHASAYEIPAHRRCVGLQLGQLFGIFRRQCVRHGGEELRHLHQRAFQPAKDGAQILCMAGPVGLHTEHPLPGQAGGNAANRGGSAGHSADFAKHRRAFIRHAAGLQAHQ